MMEKAFRLSLPILWAYLFLGFSYGLLASSMGYPVWISLSMAMAVYSGSVEFIALTILCRKKKHISDNCGVHHGLYGIKMGAMYAPSWMRKKMVQVKSSVLTVLSVVFASLLIITQY